MLHVLAGAECNNHCLFCMEADREGRRRHVLSQSPEDVRRFLWAHGERDEVLFTSGEPTLSPDLDRYVEWAREAGYRTIALISNGRRLSQPKYAAALVRRGVNKVTISIHGRDAATHDALTQSKGAFRQTLRALENLAALRRAGHRIDLHTSTVVVKPNLPQVADVHRMLRGLGVDRVCFNVMMVKGFGADRFEALMPRYAEVAQAFRGLLAGLPGDEVRRVAVADLPRCAARDLPAEVLMGQESFAQFEPLGSVGIADADLARAAADDAGVGVAAARVAAVGVAAAVEGRGPSSPGLAAAGEGQGALRRLRARAARADLRGDGAWYVTDRSAKDDVLRVKVPGCAECLHDATCPGVWRGYAQAHGTAELVAVTGEGGEAGARGAGDQAQAGHPAHVKETR